MRTPLPQHPNSWQTRQTRPVYENPWIAVNESDVHNPAGNPGIYGVVHFKNLAIGVIPLDEKGNVTLVGQFRYPLNAYSWEIPEGGGKIGVPALDSAQRELLEETGLIAESWRQILTIHLSNSVSDEIGYIYLAQNLRQDKPSPEETEDLRLITLPLKEVYERVCEAEITDSLTVAGILRLWTLHLENPLF